MSEITDDSFVSTISALVLTIVLGVLSMIASFIIIYIIYKSESNLSTTYHRIMCGMSVADIIKCIAIILTTLPMPRELPEGVVDYGWKGARLGNIGTCQAQGFIFTIGMFSVYAYYTSLISFYTLKLGCKAQQGTITRYIEPGLHLFPIALALGVSIRNILQDLYRPNNVHVFCTAYGEGGSRALVSFVMFTLLLLGYTCICFLVIIIRVRSEHHNAAPNIIRRGGNYNDSSENTTSAATPSFNPTKVILVQASAYIVAFVLTLGFPLIALASPENFWLYSIVLLFFYSQGIFNALIFVSHKVYNYRRINQNKSIGEVIIMLFCGEAHDDVYISRIMFVDHDINDVRLQRQDDLEIMERIQFQEESISIESNDYGESGTAKQCGIELVSIPIPPMKEVNEDQERLDASVICFDDDEGGRSVGFGSLGWQSSLPSFSTNTRNTDLNCYSEK